MPAVCPDLGITNFFFLCLFHMIWQCGFGYWLSSFPLGFWDSELCHKKSSVTDGSAVQQRVKQAGQRTSLGDNLTPVPHTRSPSQLECSQSNGALCFINPLFLQTHHSEPASTETVPLAASGENCALSHSSSSSTQGKSRTSPQSILRRAISKELPKKYGVNREKSLFRSPPPRPPPPRTSPHRPTIPVKQKSMPETGISWIKMSPEKTGLLGLLSSSFSSLSPSSSPPKKISSPIPMPSCHGKRAPSIPDALEDQIIEQAVSQSLAKQALRNAAMESRSPAEEGSPMGRERLSDISISTSSSDSLDYTHSFTMPTAASPSRADSSLEEEEEEEEEDDGVGVESDQELSMEPPFKPKKRHSAGTFVLPRALKGHLRKVSGVFNSLMTPEKRAVKRIVEQSQNKGTYFGCLVQDYVSFMQENSSCHESGLELLQTVRQFMTQMKSYLLQSSELNPPIESLIPEDQIGKDTLYPFQHIHNLNDLNNDSLQSKQNYSDWIFCLKMHACFHAWMFSHTTTRHYISPSVISASYCQSLSVSYLFPFSDVFFNEMLR